MRRQLLLRQAAAGQHALQAPGDVRGVKGLDVVEADAFHRGRQPAAGVGQRMLRSRQHGVDGAASQRRAGLARLQQGFHALRLQAVEVFLEKRRFQQPLQQQFHAGLEVLAQHVQRDRGFVAAGADAERGADPFQRLG
jgi:hypothetical protein